MFPFKTRGQWLRGDRVAHTAAIAALAEPLLGDAERRLLAERRHAFTSWARVGTILLSILLVGTLTSLAGGVVAALGLAGTAATVAAVAASAAGLVGFAYALVTMHVNRLEADLWGVLALAALRRASGQPSTGPSESPPR